MSFDALKWAAGQQTGTCRTKLVLLGLANAAGKATGLAWPSIAELAEFAELDRKSVMRCLARLAGSGMIEDTGQRRGLSGRVKVWRLALGQSSLDLPAPAKRSLRGAALLDQQRSHIRDHSMGDEQSPQRDHSDGGEQSRLEGQLNGPNGPMAGIIPPAGPLEAENSRKTAANEPNSPSGGIIPPMSRNSPSGGTRNQLEPVSKGVVPLTKSRMADCERVFDAWNAMASVNALPIARQLTEDRKRKLKARLAEHGADTIVQAIADIPRSAFLLGDNAQGWKAHFDFLLIPARLNKLVEGAYSNKPGQTHGQQSEQPHWKTLNEGVRR